MAVWAGARKAATAVTPLDESSGSSFTTSNSPPLLTPTGSRFSVWLPLTRTEVAA